MHWLKLVVTAVVICLAAPASKPVVLNVDTNGILLGAQGVNVNGALYDVQFVDGSCASEFSGCDDPGDFVFTTLADALAAAQALLDQVFVDGPAGQFDTLPALTFGYGDNTSCFTNIPYQISTVGLYKLARAENDIIEGTDAVASREQAVTTDTTNNNVVNFAKFAPSTIPVPASVFLLGAGIAGLAALRLRR